MSTEDLDSSASDVIRRSKRPEVARIFVNAAIKKALCREPAATAIGSTRSSLVGHDYHFHVRLNCP